MPARAARPVWTASDKGEEAILLVARHLRIPEGHARRLLSAAAEERDRGLEVVAEVRLHTETAPAGYHAGAVRWLITWSRDGRQVKLARLEDDVRPRTPERTG
jgi:hypothetical protein